MALDSNVVGGNNSAGKANVDANFNLAVRPPINPAQTGFVGLVGLNDMGTQVAGGHQNTVYVTEGNGAYTATKNLLWDDTFNATAQNTGKYKYAFTTMTAAQAGGFLTLNSGAITTVSTSCGYQTWKSFPLFGKAELRVNFALQLQNGAPANTTQEFGLFQANLNGAAPGAPSDGVFFRTNAAGELRGVINYNGTETQTAAMAMPNIAANHDWMIVVQTNTVLFYIDDILYGRIRLVTDAPTQGQPMMAAALPITWRVYNTASAVTLAPIMRVTDVSVSEMGPDLARPWPTQKASFGHMAYQGQNGQTMGSTANLTNSALAAATALSNTAVGTGNPAGLGGYAHSLPTLAAGTDGIIVSYQVPTGGVNSSPRNLIITGVWIHSIVDVVLAGGPLAMVYSLAFGHTAVSLATAESASFTTGTTKAPRRIMLGCEGAAANAAAGTLMSPQGIYRQFVTPIVVAPGEFVAVVGRNMGTVTTTGSVVHTVGFDAYFE